MRATKILLLMISVNLHDNGCDEIFTAPSGRKWTRLPPNLQGRAGDRNIVSSHHDKVKPGICPANVLDAFLMFAHPILEAALWFRNLNRRYVHIESYITTVDTYPFFLIT